MDGGLVGSSVLCASVDVLSSYCESFVVCVRCGCDARALGGTCTNDSAIYMKRSPLRTVVVDWFLFASGYFYSSG